jgi:hypothetical protein
MVLLNSSIAGGTTAKPPKPPFIFGFSGALQFKVTGALMELKVKN